MNDDITKSAEFATLLNSALEHHTDGVAYNGYCVGLARPDGPDAYLVPLVTAEQMEAGDMYVENAKVLFRVTVAVVS